MQTQLYTSIVYQIRHLSLLINSFYLVFKRLMTSILGLEARENTSSRTYVGIFTGSTSSSCSANYAVGKTAQNQTNISITEVVNTVLENV